MKEGEIGAEAENRRGSLRDFHKLLFSFRGRANRAKWWVAFLIFSLFLVMSAAADAALSWILLLIVITSYLAISTRRLHDQEKSGWWLLLFSLGPVVLGSIANDGHLEELSTWQIALSLTSAAIEVWAIVWLGCLRGTVGANEYGLDPIENRPISDYDQVVQRNPKDAMAFNNRGDAYFDKGEYERAIQDYSQAIALDPQAGMAHSNSGFAHLKMGQVDRAIADFDASLRLDPKNEEALYGRGIAKLRKHDNSSGNADIAAAKAIQADIAQQFAKHGIEPDGVVA